MNSRYIPPSRFVAPSGAIRPSGDLSRNQIMQFQTALYTLGHIPASGITSTLPVASPAQILAFQQNYNAENRCRRHEAGAPCQPGRVYGAPYQPARISPENGLFGPQTQAALTNYLPFAASAIRQQAQTAVQTTGPAIEGVGGAPGAETSITPLKAPKSTTAITPTPSSTPAATPRPAPTPAPSQQQPPSESFPVAPLLAVVAGAAVLAGAVWYRRGSRKRKGG